MGLLEGLFEIPAQALEKTIDAAEAAQDSIDEVIEAFEK